MVEVSRRAANCIGPPWLFPASPFCAVRAWGFCCTFTKRVTALLAAPGQPRGDLTPLYPDIREPAGRLPAKNILHLKSSGPPRVHTPRSNFPPSGPVCTRALPFNHGTNQLPSTVHALGVPARGCAAVQTPRGPENELLNVVFRFKVNRCPLRVTLEPTALIRHWLFSMVFAPLKSMKVASAPFPLSG